VEQMFLQADHGISGSLTYNGSNIFKFFKYNKI